MAQINSEQMLSEMDSYLNEAVSAEAEAESTLPFETLDDYLGDPNGFGDVTAKLWKKVSAVFDLAAKYNRHSSEYLKSCAQLERGIKFLGSSCLQKYALEEKNHVFPELKQLNTANLYTMAAIHFNKIDRALSEYMEQKQAVDDALLDMEYRFYHLMERIRATEVKIRRYDDKRFYGEEDYTPLVHGLAFSKKSWTKDIHHSDEPLAFQRARAFSAPVTGAHGDCSPAAAKSAQVTVPSAASLPENKKSDENLKNEELRMKNEEKEIAGIENSEIESSDPDENLKNEELRMKNEENEEGRSKNEETTGTVAEGSELSRRGLSRDNSDSSFLHLHSSLDEAAPLPPFVKILQRVMERSKDLEDGALTFTFEEMEFLAKDPVFAHFEPQMAADIRKVLAEAPPGT